MRPNVDIPWSVHGQIKEYAHAAEMTIEDAYIETLEEGLPGISPPVQSDDQFIESGMYSRAIGPRTVPIPPEEIRDINTICTFIPRQICPRQAVTFKTPLQRTTTSEIIHGLARTSSILNEVHNDWFTFHQHGGAWVGTGMENFVHGLQTLEDRLNDAEFETANTGFAVYVLNIRDSEYMLLHLQIDARSGTIESFTLGFLTDGHPFDGNFYRRIAGQFGVPKVDHAKDRDIDEITVKPTKPLHANVVERLVKDEPRTEDPWISGLIIENPIQQHDEIRDAVLSHADKEFRDRSEYRNPYAQLASYDHAYVRLTHYHPSSEDHEYYINEITAQKLTPVFQRQDIWNITTTVNW